MITEKELKKKVDTVVKRLKLKDVDTDVEKNRMWFHVLVATEDFRGKTASERENIMWREFEKEFDDETILSISQCYLLTPEEKETVFQT